MQEFPFYAFYKVALLRPKDYTTPTDALYYISYLLTRERWRYIYARKFGKARLASTVLFVPSKGGKPDYECMVKIVRQCAGFDVIRAFRKSYEGLVSDEAKELMKEWVGSRRPSATVAKMIEHPAHRRLVSFGNSIVPLLLQELKREPEHWFHALHSLTGASPVPEASRGNLKLMAQAWVKWGQDNGLIDK